MFPLYGLLMLTLFCALGLLATPFIMNKMTHYKAFFIISLLASVFVFSLYQMSGNKPALSQWLVAGKKHYQLQEQFIQLGGVDGAIARINESLREHPADAEGWFILGKLYLAKHNDAEALTALTKAHQLQPENEKISQYYTAVVNNKN